MFGDGQFVLFPLGRKRFALPADTVAELARPDRLQEFPHTTPMLAGVLVRRGRIVPVCDVAETLVGPDSPPRKFYLIANRSFGDLLEWTAIPVTGECELATAEAVAPAGSLPAYVIGLLTLPGEIVEVIDLETLVAAGGAQ
jgi:chemotaxis signal transduction protein